MSRLLLISKFIGVNKRIRYEYNIEYYDVASMVPLSCASH